MFSANIDPSLSENSDPFFTSTAGYFRRICEGKSLSISCGYGREIDIKFAFYGRRQRGVCSVLGLDSNTNCGAANSVTIAKNTCQGQQSCVLHATNSEFGDPCVDTEKYLDISSAIGFLVRKPIRGWRVLGVIPFGNSDFSSF